MSETSNVPADRSRGPGPAAPSAGAPPPPFGYFDRAYVINPDATTDRLERITARLGRLGIAFERFAAIEVRGDEPVFPARPRLTPGCFASARSHMAVLRMAMERGHERAIVLEDDAVFRDDAPRRMAGIVERLRAIEWDVFYFGLHLVEAAGRISPELGIVKRGFHAHAYAVSRRAMPVLVEIIEASMRLGFNWDCHEMPRRPLLRVYADPILAVQEPGYSGVFARYIDRLGQYFPPFDRGKFFANCAEARGWEQAARSMSAAGSAPGTVLSGTGANACGGHSRDGCATNKVSGSAATTGITQPSAFAPVLSGSMVGRNGATGNGFPFCTAAVTPDGTGEMPTPGSGSGAADLGLPFSAAPVDGRGGAAALPGSNGQSSASPLLREAKRHHKANRLAEAERLYRLTLEHEPRDAAALHFFGMLEYQRGRTAVAVEMLGRAVELRPDNAEYRAKYGMALAAASRNDEALVALDRAIEADGKHAEAHHNRGVVLDRLGRADEAMAAWKCAIELRPTYDEALDLLGKKLLAGNQAEAALPHLAKAVRANPRNASAHNNLGVALRKEGDIARAAEHFRRATVLRPGHAEAHSNLGIALYELGKPAEAVPHLEKAAELRPDFTDAHWNLALSLLGLGEFDRGWMEHEWRRRLPADVAQHRPLPQPEWNGCNLTGRTLLVVCEQGLGDTLQFVRYAPLLLRRGAAKVIVECQPPLRELLATLEGVAAGVQVVARGEPLPPFDMHVRIMSAPGMLGTRLGSVPADGAYLKADERRVAEWKQRFDGGCGVPTQLDPSISARTPLPHSAGNGTEAAQPSSGAPGGGEEGNGAVLLPTPNVPTPDLPPPNKRPFRIGISWQGNPAFPSDRCRSVPLSHFAPLAGIPGVRLFSLQKNHGVEQLAEARKHFPIVDFSPALDDGCGAFLDTAAVMANLDLVVSSDTSIVHLAGALGVRVWMATSFACDWRWLRDRDDSPWYPTLRLFRQPRRGDWAAVFERMADALRDTLASADHPPAQRPPAAVPIAPGDLIDRLTILQIKAERLNDPIKLSGIRAELSALQSARERSLPASEQLEALARDLRRVNEELWGIEDDIRLCENSGDFGPKFIELARSVYRTNDRRADLKRQVNAMLRSEIGDEKQYRAYQSGNAEC